jgi:hypothetical protein
MEEIWKDVIGYEGFYQVSNLGRVRSFDRLVKRNRHIKGRIHKLTLHSDGYYIATLYKENKEKKYKAHRLVAMAFVQNPNNKPFINHKDGNKLNNLPENLEWCTIVENNKHAFDTGLNIKSGENHHNHKISETQVLEIRSRPYQRGNARMWAKEFGVSREAIQEIIARKTWCHI